MLLDEIGIVFTLRFTFLYILMLRQDCPYSVVTTLGYTMYATRADRVARGQGSVVFVFYSQKLVVSAFWITTHLG